MQEDQIKKNGQINLDDLITSKIYAWTTKRSSGLIGFLDLIGTPDSPKIKVDDYQRIWNTKSKVDKIELFMNLSKIYLSFISNIFMINGILLTMKYSIWIKIPNEERQYLKYLESKSRLGKRKNKYTLEYNLLASRSLKELFEITEYDGHIQLGDLTFESENIQNLQNLQNLQNTSQSKRIRRGQKWT